MVVYAGFLRNSPDESDQTDSLVPGNKMPVRTFFLAVWKIESSKRDKKSLETVPDIEYLLKAALELVDVASDAEV